ncbi:class IIb bacteriocin, lactobin A/cerein 7B family [Colwellia sp. TT2012]|nr:class IIb bacteriocin, lactobin A/cerein 7B family [Colwellia sp. TT2012]
MKELNNVEVENVNGGFAGIIVVGVLIYLGYIKMY